MLFNALVLPLFDYCDAIYQGTANKYIDRLQRLQNRAGRVILTLPRRSREHIDVIMCKLNWLRLRERHRYHIAILVYKCLNNQVPPYLNVFRTVQDTMTTSLYLRSSDSLQLHVPRYKLNVYQQSFLCNGANIWNELPAAIRKSESINSFKSKLLNHIKFRPVA